MKWRRTKENEKLFIFSLICVDRQREKNIRSTRKTDLFDLFSKRARKRKTFLNNVTKKSISLSFFILLADRNRGNEEKRSTKKNIEDFGSTEKFRLFLFLFDFSRNFLFDEERSERRRFSTDRFENKLFLPSTIEQTFRKVPTNFPTDRSHRKSSSFLLLWISRIAKNLSQNDR